MTTLITAAKETRRNSKYLLILHTCSGNVHAIAEHQTKSRNVCFGLQYIASLNTTQHVSPINVVEPSTSTECNSAAAPQNSQGVHAEPVPSTSSESDPEVGCLNTQGIDHSEVALEGPLVQLNVEPLKANQKSVPTHKSTSDVGCQINTRGIQLTMKLTDSQSTQTDENFYGEEVIFPDEGGPSHEQKITSKGSILCTFGTDEKSHHSNNSQSETEDSKAVNPQDDVKFLVFKLELVKLSKRCRVWCRHKNKA